MSLRKLDLPIPGSPTKIVVTTSPVVAMIADASASDTTLLIPSMILSKVMGLNKPSD